MLQIARFTFNPFQENTYIAYDETRECAIIDPGCYTPSEKEELERFIAQMRLKPVRLLNTHCHIDHVFGNRFVAEKYGLELAIPDGEQFVLEFAKNYAEKMMGLFYEESPQPAELLREDDTVRFGVSAFRVLSTPGHSPASVCFFAENDRLVFAGDVLFKGSIGRYDLPGGNLEILMQSIFDKLLILNDDVKVFPGHGAATTIGKERRNNPYILEWEKDPTPIGH